MARPQLGVGGAMPMPRKERAASAPMAPGIRMVVRTVIVAARLGRISPPRMRPGEAPNERAAVTKLRCLSDMVWPRAIRAIEGQPKTPMMRIMKRALGKVEGTRADRAIMKTRAGKASMKSVKRERAASSRPPQ